MGRYRKVEQQLSQLKELQGIVASMKTLSQLELHKLGSLVEGHQSMMQTLEQTAADFARFYPRPLTGDSGEIWLVIGSERGFCGDFNAALLKRLLQACPECTAQPQRILAVGRKLWLRMEETRPGFVPLSGASVSEELPHILTQVVTETQRQLTAQNCSTLRLLFHGGAQGQPQNRRLLPPDVGEGLEHFNTPPLLQLAPEHFYAEFLQHYLYLSLTEFFTASLLAENHHRVQHLEGALNRLDDRLQSLGSRARTLRQEEITEEIETILLGSTL